jgi:hypothetical protein
MPATRSDGDRRPFTLTLAEPVRRQIGAGFQFHGG